MGCTLISIIHTNHFYISASPRAWNHAFAGFLITASYWSFRNSFSYNKTPVWLFITGVFLSSAVGTRATMIYAIIPYLAAIYIYSVNKVPKTLLKLVTPFLLGFSVSAIPSIFLFVKAPDNFLFGTIQYASLNTQFRFDSGFQGSFTFFEKLRFLLELILEYPSNLLILIFSMFLGVLYMVYRKPGNNTFPQNCVLPISMVLFLSIGSFLPTPSWPQYFYAPFPFIIIFGAECMSALTKVNQEWMQRIYLTFVIAAVLSISLASAEISRIPLIADKNNWQTTYVQVVGNKLKQTVKSRTVLTLSPVYVIEAGLNIFPQLTTGPFA